MRGARSKGVTPFSFELVAFGARQCGNDALLYVIEARNECEARMRLAVVAGLFGVADSSSMEIVQLEVVPSGVPVFLRSFFEDSELDNFGVMLLPENATLQ